MLPYEVYRPRSYPPPGRHWIGWGDPQLDRAFKGISEEARANLEQKKDAMRQMHKDRLEKQGLTPIQVPTPPTPVQRYSIADEPTEPPPEEGEESYHSAGEEEQGPSRTARMLEGTKHLVKNHAWPFTRTFLPLQPPKRPITLQKGAA